MFSIKKKKFIQCSWLKRRVLCVKYFLLLIEWYEVTSHLGIKAEFYFWLRLVTSCNQYLVRCEVQQFLLLILWCYNTEINFNTIKFVVEKNYAHNYKAGQEQQSNVRNIIICFLFTMDSLAVMYLIWQIRNPN